MMKQDFAHTNRFFCLGLLTTALILSIGLPASLLAEPQPRAQGVQMLIWHSYFPLETGNRWVYAVQGPGSLSRTWEVQAKGEQSKAFFRSYFELSGYFGGKDPRLVRPTVFGTVQELGDNGKEYLWYEFGGRVGRSWVMELAPGDNPDCEDGAKLTIGARDEVITVPAGEFKQVIRIDFMTMCLDAGITREWFAPGVGLVRREETSFGGPVVSELVYAEIGEKVFPASVYSTALQLSASSYVNNLEPPVDLSKLPRVRGTFVVHDNTDEPAELVFSLACRGLQLEVRNQAGEVVLLVNTLKDLGCPTVITRFDLRKEALVVPFSFRLADESGKPLPDGAYTITAVLQPMLDALRPAAKAVIQVKSVH